MNRVEAKAKFLAQMKEVGVIGEFAEAIATKLMAGLVFESDLIEMLHENRAHPHFEYQTTESGRSDPDTPPPPGQGWEENVDYLGGYNKHDNYVDNFWRREKKWQLTDTVPIYELPEVRVAKRKLSEVFAKLRATYPAGVIAGGTGTSYTSKPDYVGTPNAFFNGHARGGLLAYSPDITQFVKDEEWAQFPFKVREATTTGPVYFYLTPEDHPFELLIDGADPEGNSWVRVRTKGGDMGPWERAVGITPLPYHPTAWEHLTDMV